MVLGSELPATHKARFQTAIRFLNDPTLYEDLLHQRPVHPSESPSQQTYSMEDVRLQMKHGHVSKQASPRVLGIPFTVYEEKFKEICESLLQEGDIPEKVHNGVRYIRCYPRRRPILWPRIFNDRSDLFKMYDIDLPSLEAQLAPLQPGMKFRAYDLTASFFQLPLDPSVQPFYSFVAEDGETYSYSVLPMGFFGACEVMQVIHLSIVYLAQERTGLQRVPFNVYIDNVRFASRDEDELETLSSMYRSLCDQVSVALNEEPCNNLHTEEDFCGVHYACSDTHAFIRLPVGQVSKIQRDLAILLSSRCTVADFTKVVSRLFWGSRVLHLDLGFAYYAIKFLRKVSYDIAKGLRVPSDQLNMWSSVRPVFQHWGALLIANKAVEVHLERPAEFLLATDASLKGYGAVLVNRLTGEVDVFGGPFSHLESNRSINELETIAVQRAFTRFAHKIEGAHVKLFLDNNAAKASLQRGRSASFLLNDKVLDALPPLRKSHVTFERLATKDMVADEPSRNLPLDVPKLQRWVTDNFFLSPIPNCVACDGLWLGDTACLQYPVNILPGGLSSKARKLSIVKPSNSILVASSVQNHASLSTFS